MSGASVRRINAPTWPTVKVPSVLRPDSPEVLAAKMLREFRRKVLDEARELRAYIAEADVDEKRRADELRRVCSATADRLEQIVGSAPV